MGFLDRALALTDGSDPERAVVLTRWGMLARELGRAADARASLAEAVELARSGPTRRCSFRLSWQLQNAQGDTADPAWTSTWTRPQRSWSTFPRAASLVEGLAETGSRSDDLGRLRRGDQTADSALALADELAVPRPTRALLARGGSRSTLGDDGGLTDGREALDLDVAGGVGYRAAIAYNNLAVDTALFEGPLAALAILDEGEAFAIQRGLTRGRNTILASKIDYLSSAGRLDDAIRIADELVPVAQASGDFWGEFEATMRRALACLEQGRNVDIDALVVAARDHQLPDDMFVEGSTATAGIRARSGDALGSRRVLEGMLHRGGLEDNTELATRLPMLVRTAIAVESLPVAVELVHLVEPNVPIRRNSLASSRAFLEEADGRSEEAAELFRDAADRWAACGGVLEQAHAMLGQGRCLVALGDAAANRPIQEARALFERMGATPRIDECNTLLGEGLPIVPLT